MTGPDAITGVSGPRSIAMGEGPAWRTTLAHRALTTAHQPRTGQTCGRLGQMWGPGSDLRREVQPPSDQVIGYPSCSHAMIPPSRSKTLVKPESAICVVATPERLSDRQYTA